MRECWENQEFSSMNKKKKRRERETCVGGKSKRSGNLKTRGRQKKRTQQHSSEMNLIPLRETVYAFSPLCVSKPPFPPAGLFD